MWILMALLISLLVWFGVRNDRLREEEEREAFIRRDLCR